MQIHYNTLFSVAALATSLLFFPGLGLAEQQPDNGDLGKIAKMTSNPLGAAWMLWFQNDYTRFRGDALDGRHEYGNTSTFQPVMSFPFQVGDDDWNFIARPVLQYRHAPIDKKVGHAYGGNPAYLPEGFSPQDPYHGRTSGFGDSALLTLVGPAREDGVVWGVGVSQIFPTAEHKVLGQDKWQAGPAVLAARLAPDPGGWNYGALAQHWWSYAGNDERDDTSQTDIQYFLNYRSSATELIGMTPNIRVDWKADSGEKVSFPIGLGYSNVVKFGRMPVRMAIELQHYVKQPDEFGPDWNLRLLFVPVVANPFAGY